MSGYRNLTHPTLTQTQPAAIDDAVLSDFREKGGEEKDDYTCDQIFAMYLREVCRKVNENYYRTMMRFILLYRECMNEYGWIKRRETLNRAKVPEEEDPVLFNLKQKELAENINE